MNSPSVPVVVALVLLSITGAGCAIGGAFKLTPLDQVAAEEWAISSRLMDPAPERATRGPLAPHSEWAGGDCHWTWRLEVAECRTALRPLAGGPWIPATRRYRRWSDGVWELLAP